ncbi:hypothetical protein D9615_006304 [Tricholomella constricta]|uniref:O-methyltransferase domain-containing protein n=1 Tax=Tricholomella constricta TaxID=117010 RepID=A0A8H5HBB8_9AGAR|nr:hypothetical protein D9615_006304 [Tricholomella constricta]
MNASVFIILRQILHDWADPYSTKVLIALRAAAVPDTKPIIVDVDNKVAFTCNDPTFDNELGVGYIRAPAPLVPNCGVMPYVVDLGTAVDDVLAQIDGVHDLDTLLKSTE